MRAGSPGERRAGVRPWRVLGQCGVLEFVSSPTDADRPTQQFAQFRCEAFIPAVDGVLNVAQHVGKTDLMTGRQFLLSGITIRHPDFGTMIAQNIFCHRSGPARCDLAQDGESVTKVQCQFVTPSIRVVVSSDAMTGASLSLALIRQRNPSSDLPSDRTHWQSHPGYRHPEQPARNRLQPFETGHGGCYADKATAHECSARRACLSAGHRVRPP